jgi:hypothetical protein
MEHESRHQKQQTHRPNGTRFLCRIRPRRNRKYIAQGDAQGVALASIQSLYQELTATKNELQQRNEEIKSLQTRMEALEKLLTRK